METCCAAFFPGSARPQAVKDEEESPTNIFVWKFQPGASIGVKISECGVVKAVEEGGQAQAAGIGLHWVCSDVGGLPYSLSALKDALEGDKPFNVTFHVGEMARSRVDKHLREATEVTDRYKKAKEAYDNAPWYGASAEVHQELAEAETHLPKADGHAV